MRGKLKREALIALIALSAGLVANQVSPRGIPLLNPPKNEIRAEEYITIERAKELWGSGVLFLDAREPDDYESGHIGNALNLPALSFETHFSGIAPMLSANSELVIYCDGKECDLSHRLVEDLRKRGYTNTHILFNGWSSWKSARLPTQAPK